MPTAGGPNTLGESNLVFAYDTGDVSNSYKGEPTTNLLAAAGSDAALERSGADYPYYAVDINSVVQSNWSAGNNTLTISFEGKRDYVVGGTGGGGDGYPVFYVYFTDWSWAATLGITSYDWTTNSYTFTMPNPSGKYVYFSIYHMNAGNPGKSYSRKHQIEFKPHKTQFANGTRSATQGLLPLVGNSTLNLTNVSFDSNAKMIFDGTNDYVDCGAAQPFDLSTRIVTWEAVVKFNNTSGAEAIMTRWNNSTGEVWWFGRYATTKIHVAFIIGGGYYGYYSDGDIGTSTGYYHVAVTLNNTVLSYYINGVLDSTDTVAAGTWTSDPDPNLLIGAQNQGAASNLNGEIPVAKIYNRALTAQEVKQNYQQYKTRFNLS